MKASLRHLRMVSVIQHVDPKRYDIINKKNLCDVAIKHYFKFAELTSLEMDLKVALCLFKALGRDKKIQDELENYTGYSGKEMEDLVRTLNRNARKNQRMGKEDEKRNKAIEEKTTTEPTIEELVGLMVSYN